MLTRSIDGRKPVIAADGPAVASLAAPCKSS